MAQRTALFGCLVFLIVILLSAVFWPLPEETTELGSAGEVVSDRAENDEAEYATSLKAAREWLTQVKLADPQEIDFDSVEHELRETIEILVERFSDDYRTHHLAGLVYSQFKQSSLAESALRKSIDLNQTDVKVRIDLAKVLMQTGRDNESLEVLAEVRERGTSSGAYLLLLADLQARVGKLEEAIETLEAGNKVDPNSPEIWLQTGKLQYQLGDLQEAEASIQKSLQISRGNEQAWLALCQVLAAQKATAKLTEARREFEICRAESLKRNRVFEEVHHQSLRRFAVSSLRSVALLYFEHQLPEQALRLLQRALELEPADLPSLNALAAYYRRINRFDLASETSRTVLFIAPQDYVNYTNLASLCMECNDAIRAEAVLRMASERAVAPEQSHLNLAKFLMLVNKPKEALAPAKLAVHHRESKDTLAVLAQALEASGSSSEAKLHFAPLKQQGTGP